MSELIENFCSYYQKFTLKNLTRLDAIYTKDVVFEDPLHKTQGLDEIAAYFKRTMTNINDCQFQIDEALESNQQAFITWAMTFSHPKLNNGHKIILPGSSHLKFNDAIYYQRDYYDLGQMIYEQIPLLNFMISKIKNRITL